MEFFKIDHEVREIDIEAFDYPNKKVGVVLHVENESGEILLVQQNMKSPNDQRLFDCVGTEVQRSDINYRYAMSRVIKETFGKHSNIQVKDTVGIAHFFNENEDWVYVVYSGKFTGTDLEIQDRNKAIGYRFMKYDEIIKSDIVGGNSKFIIQKIHGLDDVGKIDGLSKDDAIKQRHSVRKFLNKKIEGEVLDELQAEIDRCKVDSNLRIELVLNEEDAFGKSQYGNFENCKNYIVIFGNLLEKKLDEKAGYYGEKLVIIIAVGYGVNNGHERKSKSYKDVTKVPEEIAPEWYKKGIEYALLAPTAINQQKFKIDLKEENKVSARVYGMGICTRIDLGIVKYHFEIGAGKDNFEWTENSLI